MINIEVFYFIYFFQPREILSIILEKHLEIFKIHFKRGYEELIVCVLS